ncbi:hypothetical protein [Flavobacterium sp. HJJ]|uniref:hypothetical protein n=1 Tax=Flavobacterium sp. HJJ TaxID=2783792 RepID=UPI00188D6217|nr:hypothetical protein [Flavobacterium sp. HJJ]MBF4469851.1 hypothetical protein [Flavobacterium sp. HJJ]
MKKTSLMLIFICSLFIQSCQKNNSEYLSEWKSDKNACNGVRTIEKTEVLIKELKIESSTLESVLETLGKPDKFSKSDNANYLEYYIENNCSSEEKDICLLTITFFKGQKKTEVSITCT